MAPRLARPWVVGVLLLVAACTRGADGSSTPTTSPPVVVPRTLLGATASGTDAAIWITGGYHAVVGDRGRDWAPNRVVVVEYGLDGTVRRRFELPLGRDQLFASRVVAVGQRTYLIGTRCALPAHRAPACADPRGPAVWRVGHGSRLHPVDLGPGLGAEHRVVGVAGQDGERVYLTVTADGAAKPGPLRAYALRARDEAVAAVPVPAGVRAPGALCASAAGLLALSTGPATTAVAHAEPVDNPVWRPAPASVAVAAGGTFVACGGDAGIALLQPVAAGAAAVPVSLLDGSIVPAGPQPGPPGRAVGVTPVGDRFVAGVRTPTPSGSEVASFWEYRLATGWRELQAGWTLRRDPGPAAVDVDGTAYDPRPLLLAVPTAGTTKMAPPVVLP